MSDFKASEFKLMLVNVHAAGPGADMLKIPVYRDNPEFAQKTDKINTNILLRYIPCMYDKNSPFVRHYNNDIRKRKFESAKYAGFPIDEQGKFSPEVEKKVIRCQDPFVSGMIIKYALLQNSILFQEWITLYEAYFKEQERILSDSNYSNTEKLRNISSDLKSIQDEMFQQDKNNDLMEDFYGFYVKQTLDLRVESIARKIKNGEKLGVGEEITEKTVKT